MPTTPRLSRPAAALILIIAAAGTAAATGGGGLTSGVQTHVPSFSNHDLAATAYGGFGYGTTRGGTRIGGIGAEGLPGSGGYFALYEEIDLEIGFAPLPWMQIVGYVGYQVVVSVLPGFFANEAISATPPLGLRLVWGSSRDAP